MFMKKVKSLGIRMDLYSRYVDDVVAALYAVNKGWYYNTKKNKLMFSKEKQDTDMRDNETRTAEIMVQVANSINQNIQFTWDTPGKNRNNRMPVLDLEVWIQEVEGVKTIMHSFYKKPVASRYTVLKRRALSHKIKKNTLLQEALRRLGNISTSLPWTETVTHLAEYSNMLRLSGYNERERYHNVKGAITRHREMRKNSMYGKMSLCVISESN